MTRRRSCRSARSRSASTWPSASAGRRHDRRRRISARADPVGARACRSLLRDPRRAGGGAMTFASFAALERLSQAPVQSIVDVRYLDASGVEQVLDARRLRIRQRRRDRCGRGSGSPTTRAGRPPRGRGRGPGQRVVGYTVVPKPVIRAMLLLITSGSTTAAVAGRRARDADRAAERRHPRCSPTSVDRRTFPMADLVITAANVVAGAGATIDRSHNAGAPSPPARSSISTDHRQHLQAGRQQQRHGRRARGRPASRSTAHRAGSLWRRDRGPVTIGARSDANGRLLSVSERRRHLPGRRPGAGMYPSFLGFATQHDRAQRQHQAAAARSNVRCRAPARADHDPAPGERQERRRRLTRSWEPVIAGLSAEVVSLDGREAVIGQVLQGISTFPDHHPLPGRHQGFGPGAVAGPRAQHRRAARGPARHAAVDVIHASTQAPQGGA
jgi:hypothetical protein